MDVCVCVCVCVQWGEMITPNMSLRAHTETHTHESSLSCAPDMSSMCFSTEDIPTEPDRTLRTVGPAGTAPASSTGMFGKGCWAPVNFLHIFITRFTCEHWQRSACLVAQLCASRCHFHSRQSGEFSFFFVFFFFFFHGLVGLLFCSVWQAQPECSTLGRATRRTNTAAGLITERSYESFIRTYHTHTLMLLPLRLNEVSNNTDLRRAPVCPLGSPPPQLSSFFSTPSLSLFPTHRSPLCQKNTHTPTNTGRVTASA